MAEITHRLRFTVIEGDPLGVEEGWDLNMHTGAVHLVDPEQPELYAVDSKHIVPAEIILLLAMHAEDITVEEV